MAKTKDRILFSRAGFEKSRRKEMLICRGGKIHFFASEIRDGKVVQVHLPDLGYGERDCVAFAEKISNSQTPVSLIHEIYEDYDWEAPSVSSLREK